MEARQETDRHELIAGKYRITRLMGRGGMGTVWEGVHVSLGTRVAVKFIDSEHTENADVRNRFANEAQAAARLRTKHVVQVFDHGVHEDGRSYIVMEFLSGETLDRRLDRSGRLSPQETTRIVIQVCRALTKAHAAGIVHRDLKPENIFLVWDEEDSEDIVKVVDFGIAKFTDGTASATSATRTGAMLGTPFYMSPEQARGLRTVDFRTDLWSLGVVAYECIVGQVPFDGEAVGDLVVKICTAPLPSPSQLASGVPPGFDAWFRRALERDPARRFSSAAELGEALAIVCGVPLTGGGVRALAGGPGVAPGAVTGARAASGVYTPDPWAQAAMPNPNQSSGQQATATDGGLNAAAGVVADGVQLPLKSRGLLWSVIAIVLILMVGGAAVFLSRPQDAPEIDAEADSDAEQTAEPQQPAPHPEPGPTQLPAAKKTPPGDRAASVATPAESPVEPSKPSKPSKPRKPRKPNRTKREQQSAAPKAETPQKPGGSSIDLGY